MICSSIALSTVPTKVWISTASRNYIQAKSTTTHREHVLHDVHVIKLVNQNIRLLVSVSEWVSVLVCWSMFSLLFIQDAMKRHQTIWFMQPHEKCSKGVQVAHLACARCFLLHFSLHGGPPLLTISLEVRYETGPHVQILGKNHQERFRGLRYSFCCFPLLPPAICNHSFCLYLHSVLSWICFKLSFN